MSDSQDSISNDDFQANPGDLNPLYEMKQDEKLPGDFATPFSPPGDVKDRIDTTFPASDSGLSLAELYDEGIEGATGVDMPNLTADKDDGSLDEHADIA